MEKIRYTIDEIKTKRAIKKFGRRQAFKRKMSKIGRWFIDNKEIVLVLGPAVIGLATGVIKIGTNIIKAGARHINVRAEERVKEHYCYDRSLGHYWALRRKLTNKEWIEIDARKKNGERMADILNDLHVLK